MARDKSLNVEFDIGVALGKAAYAAGIPCVTLRDPEVTERLTGRSIISPLAQALLNGWLRGWSTAHVADTADISI